MGKLWGIETPDGVSDIIKVDDTTDILSKELGEHSFEDHAIYDIDIKKYSDKSLDTGSGGSYTFNVSLVNLFKREITGDATFIFSDPPPVSFFRSFLLILKDAGAYTITWPTTIKWIAGVLPDLSTTGYSVLNFFTIDGGVIWYGFLSNKDLETI